MKRLLIIFVFLHAALTAGIPLQQTYYGPTEQLIKREGRTTIEKELKEIKISKEFFPYFDHIASRESWGHIGYHAATFDYRIYQDIIRYTLEEILDIPLRDDFHFLRVPGDNDLRLETVPDFYAFWGKEVDNKSSKRAKQLLSMNYGIYSNFDRKGSCSAYLFVHDKSKTDIDYAKELAPFYKELGISTKELKKLFKLARSKLKSYTGILLRIYENSHLDDPDKEAYNFADRQCYPCERGGYLHSSRLISEEFACIMSEDYVFMNEQVAPQLRLLINNRYTLNPLSRLCIERWDLCNQDSQKRYEEAMREAIRKLRADPNKVETYKNRLLQLWM